MKHRAIIQFTSKCYLEHFPEPVEVTITRHLNTAGIWHSSLRRGDNPSLSKLFKTFGIVINKDSYVILMLGDEV